ncbi:MAG: hypothetical protein ACRCXN_07975 [Bacteroidales bacterium]
MKNIIITILVINCLLNISCTTVKDKEPERVELDYEIIYDSIFTRMPGGLLKSKHLAVWLDPFASQDYLHIIDTETKQERTLGTIGQGPMEFTTPNISPVKDGNIFIWDSNSARQGIISIAGQSLQLQMLPPSKSKTATEKIMIAPDKIVLLEPEEDMPLALETSEGLMRFGKQPLPITQKISNGFSQFQGFLSFCPQKNMLLYSTLYYPAFSSYKLKKNGAFELENEENKDIDFEIANDKLVISDASARSAVGSTTTKDYIVRIERDTQNDKTRVSSGDFSKLPQTLFLYSHEGKLQKIVNIKTPLLRVGGDFSDNTVYAINADPEFKLIRINLDN